MKKVKLVFLTGIMIFTLGACGAEEVSPQIEESSEVEAEQQTTEEPGVTEESRATEEPKPIEEPKVALLVENGACEEGNICVFGNYQLDDIDGTEAIEWVILENVDNKILVISKNILPERRAFNDVIDLKTGATWENCSLRTWLNNEFYEDAFSAEERKAIVQSEVDNYRFTTSNEDPHNYTYDNVFCLSASEVSTYLDDSLSQEERYGTFYGSDLSGEWWLRTKAEGDNQYLLTMYYNIKQEVVAKGHHNYMEIGIRPVMCIDLNSVDISEWEVNTENVDLTTNEEDANINNENANANNENSQSEVEEVVPEITGIEVGNIGDTLVFGNYEQDNDTANGAEPITWRVIAKEDGRALLLSANILEYADYNEECVDITWETSGLRSWLNGTFLNEAFTASEQKSIELSCLETDDNPNRGTDGGNNTEDYVFCLSLAEVDLYMSGDNNGYMSAEWGARVMEQSGNKTTINWWLRTPGNLTQYAMIVEADGNVRTSGNNCVLATGVRPAIWVKTK